MFSSVKKVLLTTSAAALLLGGVLIWLPEYFASSGLAVLIGAEILMIAVANYRKAFFPVLLICFIWAGSAIPYKMQFAQARWSVLAVGAVFGLAVYMKDHIQKFRLFHLVALFCVLAGFVSALVSAYPSESLLKAGSWFLLMVYVSAGMRTAARNSARFFRLLLRAAEALAVITAVSYLVLRWEFFGNPNSLGVVLAVMVLPLLLWGQITAQSRPERLRLSIELICALLLLFSSFSRASIAAAAVSCFAICWATREFRLLMKGCALAVALSAFAVIFIPRHTAAPAWDGNESIGSLFLYKGRQDAGILGSRRSPWQKTWSVVREKPWFGSGFGTSEIDGDMTKLQYARHHVDSWVIREHGSSYLAIFEWTGLFGVVPFFGLVLLVAGNAGRTLLSVRRTGDLSSPAIAAAAIGISGLIHAGFEDWLFAVGYYVCVFFWAMASILVDVMPGPVTAYSPEQLTPEPPFSPTMVATAR